MRRLNHNWPCTAPGVLLAATLACGLASRAQDLPAPLIAANGDLQAGKADDATAKLNDFLKSDAKSAPANNLLCRVEYALQHFDPAADHCQKAVDADPQNARYHLWLGRALGERASKAQFLSAFSLAKRARSEFETAVKLDPKDADALGDLGEFYAEAPGAVGGGTDKAEGIAAKLDAVDPARGHQFRASLAEKKNDYTAAEREYKAATETGSHFAFAWMALASYDRRRQRFDDMEAAVKSGEAAVARDKHAAVALFNGGSALERANRDPATAVRLLEAYLASPDKTEEAPAFEALVKLARLHKSMNDGAAAQKDKAAALALAHDYKPAQELKF